MALTITVSIQSSGSVFQTSWIGPKTPAALIRIEGAPSRLLDLRLHCGNRLRRSHVAPGSRSPRRLAPAISSSCVGELAGTARDQRNPRASPGEPEWLPAGRSRGRLR